MNLRQRPMWSRTRYMIMWFLMIWKNCMMQRWRNAHHILFRDTTMEGTSRAGSSNMTLLYLPFCLTLFRFWRFLFAFEDKGLSFWWCEATFCVTHLWIFILLIHLSFKLYFGFYTLFVHVWAFVSCSNYKWLWSFWKNFQLFFMFECGCSRANLSISLVQYQWLE